jgi:hypothetical protein
MSRHVGRNKSRSDAVTAWHARRKWLVGWGREFRGGAAVTALALVTAYKRLLRPTRALAAGFFFGHLLEATQIEFTSSQDRNSIDFDETIFGGDEQIGEPHLSKLLGDL